MDQPEPPVRETGKVLVVEDETVIRVETADLLTEAGFEVLEAWSVPTALRQLERHGGIRLLFTGASLPGGLDGFALARDVRRRWPGLPILVASGTARPGPGDLPEGARFIGKPFSAPQVLETVRALTAG